MIRVVNKRTHKPTPDDFYIGRPSPLGNPFTHIQDKKTLAKYVVSTRDEAIKKYAAYYLEQLTCNQAFLNEWLRLVKFTKAHEHVNLVCWCAPQACHGDVLKEFLETHIKPGGNHA